MSRAWGALALIATGSVAPAMTPVPVPPDQLALAKAGQLLDAVHYDDCFKFQNSPSADMAIRRVVDELLNTAHPAIADVKDPDFDRLLALTFERQARATLSTITPAMRAERAEVLARLLNPAEIDEARQYFMTSGGERLATDAFCAVDSDRVSGAIYRDLIGQVDAIVAEVRQSYTTMKQINNSGRRP